VRDVTKKKRKYGLNLDGGIDGIVYLDRLRLLHGGLGLHLGVGPLMTR
jgi:hypothetical protein